MAPNTTLPTIVPPADRPEPGSRHRVVIERVAALGRGVAHLNGLTLLVARGVPGEEVTVVLERVHPSYALARVVSVERPAACRVEPPCPHFAACGGCDWQHVDYATQLAFKRAVLAEQLQRIARMELPEPFHLVPAGRRLGYRDKLEFTPVPLGAAYAPGFHAGHDGAPVPIAACLLAEEAMTRLAAALLEGLAGQGVLPPSSRGAGGSGEPAGPLQRLTVQASEDESGAPALAVLLHLKPTPQADPPAFRRRVADACRALLPALQGAFPALASLAIHLPGRKARPARARHRHRPRWDGPRDRQAPLEVVAGPPLLTRRVHGRAYRVPHDGFFQVNPEMAGSLAAYVVSTVMDFLAQDAPQAEGAGAGPHSAGREEASGREGRVVLDLYGGAGLFALPLAERGVRVVNVDSDRGSLHAAAASLAALGLKAGAAQRLDLERAGALEQLVRRWGAPAAVIVDPPRRGLAAVLCEGLRDLADRRPAPPLVYVSCDGGTFARDAARLAPAYRLASLRGFDLFPQTHHLELVGVFLPAAHGATM
jgi:23S rRNA (uracil1939-C5)-methyltransferase